jgi:hypothetical protein
MHETDNIIVVNNKNKIFFISFQFMIMSTKIAQAVDNDKKKLFLPPDALVPEQFAIDRCIACEGLSIRYRSYVFPARRKNPVRRNVAPSSVKNVCFSPSDVSETLPQLCCPHFPMSRTPCVGRIFFLLDLRF